MESKKDDNIKIENGTATITTGVDFNGMNGTSTSTYFVPQVERKLENVEFIENEEGNFIEITYSITSIYQLYTYPNTSQHRQLVKERYGVVDGKMKLIKTITGSETPGYFVEPTIEWEEE